MLHRHQLVQENKQYRSSSSKATFVSSMIGEGDDGDGDFDTELLNQHYYPAYGGEDGDVVSVVNEIQVLEEYSVDETINGSTSRRNGGGVSSEVDDWSSNYEIWHSKCVGFITSIVAKH